MAQIYDYDIVLESGKHITQDGVTVANSSSLAPAYDSTATYAVGDLCTHLGSLYSCSTAIGTAEEWDATHWTEVTVSGQLAGTIGFKGYVDFRYQNYRGYVVYNLPLEYGAYLVRKHNNTSDLTQYDIEGIAFVTNSRNASYPYSITLYMRGGQSLSWEAYGSNSAYNAQTVDQLLSICVPLNTYATYSSQWDTTPTSNSTKPVTSGGIYTSIQGLDNAIASILAPAYDSTDTYEVGDLCSRSASSSMTDAKLYVCTTEITVAEAWDASHWSETTLAQQLQTQVTNAINASY